MGNNLIKVRNADSPEIVYAIALAAKRAGYPSRAMSFAGLISPKLPTLARRASSTMKIILFPIRRC
jgi:hypothetical protein